MSAVYTLLLTDVVDSTAISESLGDTRMAAVWASHDRLARDLLPLWRGREIDKTDGMLLLFEAAPDAAAYAVAYHRALAQLDPPLRARAGLHVGPVILRENSASDVARGAKPLEVDGTAKAVTARVMSIANGGQTLVSADARAALGQVTLRLASHGHWRMKGITEPIELFEIGDAGAVFTPPADAAKAYRVVRDGEVWVPVRSIKHSLPAERDAFVGRAETLAELARRFEAGARLVSVLGMGGSGKTRLATRFGWTWLGDFPGGVWFCDLAQARHLDGIVYAVAQGLDVPLGRDDPVLQLGHAIAGRGQCLVILDNFEQVARHAEETLGRWLGRAGDAVFLVTTREVLGLQGEQVLAVAPLQPSDAASLFLRRAAAAKADFQPTHDDLGLVTQLVGMLDCLPLAIELAAARVRVMPMKTLLARMGDRFKLLSSTGRRLDRQATLRAVLDWSWDLLLAPEKAALAQLSVFEGGFTLESVEAVLDLSAFDEAPWPMDVLQSLVQKSLVRQVTDARFDLLVSLKEYAAEHLRTEGRFAGSGSVAQRAAENAHGRYFAGLDELVATAIQGAELDNFVAACRRAVAAGDADVAAKSLAHAWSGLNLRGPFRAAIELAAAVRAVPGLDQAALAVVERVWGRALENCGKDLEAFAHIEASLAAARAAGDRRGECRALVSLGSAGAHAGRQELARTQLEAALAAARETGDASLQSNAHNALGSLEQVLGRMAEARLHFEAAIASARKAGDGRLEGGALGNLSNLHCEIGNMDAARTCNEAVLAVARAAGDRKLEGNTLCNLGLVNQVQGNLDAALLQLGASLVVARDLGHVHLECIVLCNLGMVLEGLARIDEALAHFEAAVVIARDMGDQRSEGQFLGYLGLLHARQMRPGQARACLQAGEALLRVVADRPSLAILLCASAEAEGLAGDASAARAAQAQAQEIAGAIGAGADSELGLALARVGDLLGQGDPHVA